MPCKESTCAQPGYELLVIRPDYIDTYLILPCHVKTLVNYLILYTCSKTLSIVTTIDPPTINLPSSSQVTKHKKKKRREEENEFVARLRRKETPCDRNCEESV